MFKDLLTVVLSIATVVIIVLVWYTFTHPPKKPFSFHEVTFTPDKSFNMLIPTFLIVVVAIFLIEHHKVRI